MKAVTERTTASALDAGHDTFPKLVRDNARRLADKVAIREKDLGIWQSYTWSQYFEQARLIAVGLASLGFARGDRVAIVGDNRPQLYWAVMAAQALGGVPVPIYQDSIEREMEYIVEHSEARFAVVEDQEQVDKLLRRASPLPAPAARGLRRSARDARLQRARAHEPGRAHRARPEVRGEPPRALRRRAGEGRRRRRRDHLLHLGDHRRAEGRDAVPPELDRHGAQRGELRGASRGRRGAVVSADGLGGRPRLLLRAGDRRRVHDQLSGERGDGPRRPERDRADLLLRPAAHLGEHPDRRHGPGRGRGAAEARAGPLLPAPGPGHRAQATRPSADLALAAAPVSAGKPAGVRTAQGQPRLLACPSRVHRGRGHRPGDLPLLPRARRSTSSSSTA